MAYCSHTDTIIDSSAADEICLMCGQVLSDRLAYQELTTSTQENDCFVIVSNKEKKRTSFDYKDYVIEMSHRMHLYGGIIPSILKKYESCVTEKMTKNDKMDLASYCIYECLRENDTSRSIREISAISGISPKKIWKLEVKFGGAHNHVTASDLLRTNYSYLTLEYRDLKKMIKICINTPSSDFAPSTIAATMLYLCCKQKNIAHSMKNVADLLKTSTMSIYRYLRYLSSIDIDWKKELCKHEI